MQQLLAVNFWRNYRDFIVDEDAEVVQGLVRGHFLRDSSPSPLLPPLSSSEVHVHSPNNHTSSTRRPPLRSSQSSELSQNSININAPASGLGPTPTLTATITPTPPARNTHYSFHNPRDSDDEELYDDLLEEEELDDSRLQGGEAEDEQDFEGREEDRVLRSYNWSSRPTIFRSGRYNSANNSRNNSLNNNRRPPIPPAATIITTPTSTRTRRSQDFQNSRHHRNNGSVDSGDSSSSSSSTETNMSLALSDRNHDPNHTASLLDSMERRTQRTYRYGIGLVCVGATLNWLGFAQGHGYVDPLRYLGVACVISGSFCVCLAMCRWLGRPISVSSHRVSGLSRLDYQSEQRVIHPNGDVHVINVSVPMYVAPNMHEEYRPTKPPDYEIAVAGEPPPYDEAIKLDPNALFGPSSPINNNLEMAATENSSYFPCGHPSPSHSTTFVVLPHDSSNNTTTTTPSTNVILGNTGSEPSIVNSSNTTMTISLSENIRNNASSAFQNNNNGDSVVVVVDASESANVHHLHHHLNGSIGAPPPYTREYTPSPRRTAPPSTMSTPEHSSHSSRTRRYSATSYLIVPCHGPSNNLNNNFDDNPHQSVGSANTAGSTNDNASANVVLASEPSLTASVNLNSNSTSTLNNLDALPRNDHDIIVIHP